MVGQGSWPHKEWRSHERVCLHTNILTGLERPIYRIYSIYTNFANIRGCCIKTYLYLKSQVLSKQVFFSLILCISFFMHFRHKISTKVLWGNFYFKCFRNSRRGGSITETVTRHFFQLTWSLYAFVYILCKIFCEYGHNTIFYYSEQHWLFGIKPVAYEAEGGVTVFSWADM